jgi:hypothetical protein
MRGFADVTKIEILKRRIELRKQAVPLIKEEILEDQLRLCLLILQGRFEKQIDGGFNQDVSRKLDAVSVLLGD